MAARSFALSPPQRHGGLVSRYCRRSWIRPGQYSTEPWTTASSTNPKSTKGCRWSDDRTQDTGPSCHLAVWVVSRPSIYAGDPGRMVGRLFGDGFVLLWTVGLSHRPGIFVHRVIEEVATCPGNRGQRRDWQRTSARPRPKLPGCQSLVSNWRPSTLLRPSATVSAADQVANVERLALLGGWLVFLIPVTIVVAFWLPRRIRLSTGPGLIESSWMRFPTSTSSHSRRWPAQPLYVLAEIGDDDLSGLAIW